MGVALQIILHDKKMALKISVSVIVSADTAFCDRQSWSASKILIGAPLVNIVKGLRGCYLNAEV